MPHQLHWGDSTSDGDESGVEVAGRDRRVGVRGARCKEPGHRAAVRRHAQAETLGMQEGRRGASDVARTNPEPRPPSEGGGEGGVKYADEGGGEGGCVGGGG